MDETSGYGWREEKEWSVYGIDGAADSCSDGTYAECIWAIRFFFKENRTEFRCDGSRPERGNQDYGEPDCGEAGGAYRKATGRVIRERKCNPGAERGLRDSSGNGSGNKQ